MVKTVAGVKGMMCGMCEAHVNDAVRDNFSVKKVQSSRKKRECVIISDAPLDEEKLRDVISKTGYDVTDISSMPYEKKGIVLFRSGSD